MFWSDGQLECLLQHGSHRIIALFRLSPPLDAGPAPRGGPARPQEEQASPAANGRLEPGKLHNSGVTPVSSP